MELAWIPLSVFAALMQSVRTAAQKRLNERLSTMGTTYVRSLCGLPFLLVFLVAVLATGEDGVPQWRADFFAYAMIGALCQVLATALLIKLFTLRSFAVGSSLIRSDVLMTAVIGTLWFSEELSAIGWCALLVVLAGVALLLVGKFGGGARPGAAGAPAETLRDTLTGRAAQVALACALLFTFSYLCIREATLVLEPGHVLWRAGWTVVVVTAAQVLGLSVWLVVREPGVFSALWPNRGIASFIGLTSALGSMGWFCAFALENAAYVRSVAQVEAVFTLLISRFYFDERLNRAELAGIGVVVVGVLMFRLVD